MEKKWVRNILLVLILIAVLNVFGIISIPWLFSSTKLKIVLLCFLVFLFLFFLQFLN